MRKERKMDNYLLYLLKVSTGIILFYTCYVLFFSRDTFYIRNRFFLIGVFVLSIIVPLIEFHNAPLVLLHQNPRTF